jgi:hypothetical protein
MSATLFLRLLGLLTSLGFGYLVFDYNGAGEEIPHAVSGVVRIDGHLLDKGAIRFMPAEDNRSLGAAAEIINGEYALSEGDGLTVGKYQVCVSGLGLEESYRANLRGGTKPEDPIPARFNDESPIVVEVTEDGNLLGFDFDLK